LGQVGFFTLEAFVSFPTGGEVEHSADFSSSNPTLAIVVSRDEFLNSAGEIGGLQLQLIGYVVGELDHDLHDDITSNNTKILFWE
jgi:hypothetical protein